MLLRDIAKLLLLVALFACLPCGIVTAQQKISESSKRVPWTTSRLTGSPQPPRPYVTERVFPELAFDAPVELVAIPGTNRLVIVEVLGKMYSFEPKPGASKETCSLFADATT